MLLHIEAVALAGLSLVLAIPVPSALARARWPARAPHAALLLWQAVGLGGGLAILTAGLTLAAGSIDEHWLAGLLAVPRNLSRLGALGWFGVGLTACVGAWLISASIASGIRVVLARRVHRRILDVISQASRVGSGPSGSGVDIAVLDHPQAVAYCLPGLRSRVVLSRGALATLTEGELAAVLAHERAHARGRHDLVIQPFIAWQRTFPFLPSARHAVTAVGGLVEMLADDSALRTRSRLELSGALGKLAGQQLAVAGPENGAWRRQLDARIGRLSTAEGCGLPPAFAALVYLAAIALVTGPPAILLAS